MVDKDSNISLKDRLSLLLLTYNGSGKLTKFNDKLYGFYNSDNTVNFIRLNDMHVIEQAYSIKYILDTIIIVYPSMVLNIVNHKSYILDIETFEVIYESEYMLETIGDIIYEGNNMKMHRHQGETLPRKVFDTFGREIGEIEVFTNISIYSIEKTPYYICSHSVVGVTEEFTTICKLDKTFRTLWESNEYDVREIGDGLFSFSKYNNYRETSVYDFYKQELIS